MDGGEGFNVLIETSSPDVICGFRREEASLRLNGDGGQAGSMSMLNSTIEPSATS